MQLIESLAFPITTMMGVAFLYSSVLRSFRRPRLAELAIGILFAVAVTLAMTVPIDMGDGLRFDLRGMIVGMSVVFGGWIAGLVTLACAIAYRVYLGGGGMMSGLVGLCLAYGIGVVWRQFGAPRLRSGLVSDAAFGVVISLSLAGVFMLPFDLAMTLMTQVGPPIMIANLIGCVCLGFVLRRESKFVDQLEALRTDAAVDPLTKTLNRRGAQHAWEKLHKKRRSKGQALFYFDLDRFKEINDTYGHAAGDAALAAVAARVESCVRSDVVFSRHGGDEFTVYMTDVNEDVIPSIGERFRHAVCSEPVRFQGRAIHVSISLGASWTAGRASFDELLENADQELRRAKMMGRNRVSFAEGAMPRPEFNEPLPAGVTAIR